MVVIAGIERNAVKRAGGRDAAQHVERPIAVERRDLDGDDIVDRGKAPPEIRAEDDAADRRLQIEADQRDLARDRLAMRDDLVFGGRFHRSEAEQARHDNRCRVRFAPRRSPAGSGRQGLRPWPSGRRSRRRRFPRQIPAPGGTCRPRGSRIGWCGRRPPGRRRRHRHNSVLSARWCLISSERFGIQRQRMRRESPCRPRSASVPPA